MCMIITLGNLQYCKYYIVAAGGGGTVPTVPTCLDLRKRVPPPVPTLEPNLRKPDTKLA
jgi:hypothetical protein